MNPKSIYGPIKEQFLMLIEYVRILELRKNTDHSQEISLLIEMINNVKRNTEIYLNYCFVRKGKIDD